ncbi:hypothetical protein OGH69_14545 [Flavobacterium sp. MFBS3-15]|uniref:hypothetical protein n=1 Tax=Flavobacterium sp. MFBS3-15 TaxID=2989816 RepID=UPI0022364AAA|nr:hypothetical protein [Flavobacterium sp. MFBS3-15]MCW4470194.1 hypothetical protein [Flavobacterium sp. MFBS3-15]
MIKIIDDQKTIKILQNRFHQRLFELLPETEYAFVGFPAGSFRDNIHYSSDLQIWTSFHEEDNRFWNGFGVGKPVSEKGISLVGEINFPFKGINRRIAGVFAEDENGEILILHRGKIGGGTKGVGKKLFFRKHNGEFITAWDGGRKTEFALVGELESEFFIEQIADFIHSINRIKKGTPIEYSNTFSELKNFKYSDEKYGVSITESNEPKIINRIHGIVVNALAAELVKLKYSIGKDRNRDLFIHSKNKITHLFEIKTTISTQCLYSALGQLLIYSLPIKNRLKLFAVLPNKLSEDVELRFNESGINILYYKWENKKVVFPNLKSIL